MKNKYKVLGSVLCGVLLCSALTGCDERDGFHFQFKHYTTTTELNIINELYAKCDTPPTGVVDAIAARNKNGADLSESESFQDSKVKAAVLAYDNMVGCGTSQGHPLGVIDSSYTIEALYYKIYHKKLYGAKLPNNVENRDVVVNDKQYLSPEMIDKLTDSVKDCFNAKRKVSILMDSNNGLLTKDDYNQVMNLVLQCKTSKLHEEVNRN